MILKAILIILLCVTCASCAFHCFNKSRREKISLEYENKKMDIEYLEVMGLPVAKKVYLDIGEVVSLCLYLPLRKTYVSFLDDEMYNFFMKQEEPLQEMITYNGQRFVEIDFFCYYAEVVKKDPELIRLANEMEATGKSICKVFYPDV